MELAPAKKHRACISSLISVRPAERRTNDVGIMMRASAMTRTKRNRIDLLLLLERRAGNGDQHVDRHALRRLGKIGERDQHVDAVLVRLAQADDAAGADLHAGVAHALERIEAILERARLDDSIE